MTRLQRELVEPYTKSDSEYHRWCPECHMWITKSMVLLVKTGREVCSRCKGYVYDVS